MKIATLPAPADTLGVTIRIGDRARVTSCGWAARLVDCGARVTVTGFTARGNVEHSSADVANGRAIKPGCLAVARRDGANGHEGNVGRG